MQTQTEEQSQPPVTSGSEQETKSSSSSLDKRNQEKRNTESASLPRSRESTSTKSSRGPVMRPIAAKPLSNRKQTRITDTFKQGRGSGKSSPFKPRRGVESEYNKEVAAHLNERTWLANKRKRFVPVRTPRASIEPGILVQLEVKKSGDAGSAAGKEGKNGFGLGIRILSVID